MVKIVKAIAPMIIALLFTWSCAGVRGDDLNIIDVGKTELMPLRSLASQIRVVQLDEALAVQGGVMFAKSYSNCLFLFDDALRRIIMYDLSGHQVSLLDKVGRAKGEYIEIGTFAYSSKYNLLCIFDRGSKSIKCYDADDMTFREEISLDFYVNAMESTADGRLVLVREKSASCEGGLSLIDIETREFSVLMDLREDQADLMMDTCFSHTMSGDLLLCIPGYPNEIVEYSDGRLVALDSLIMAPCAMDADYWNGRYSEDKENYLVNAVEANADVALIPAFYLPGSRSSSFWFVTSEERSFHSLPSMSLVIDKNAFSPFVSDGNRVSPVGVSHSGEYISIVETELVSEYIQEDIKSELSILLYSF